jgi:hypothetical protein
LAPGARRESRCVLIFAYDAIYSLSPDIDAVV